MTEYTLPKPTLTIAHVGLKVFTRAHTKEIADKAYAAGLEAGRKAPEGWKLVPKTATREMRAEMLSHWHLKDGYLQNAFDYLLAAAPEYKP